MPKYTVEYAFDCSCYGNRLIEANSPDAAAEIAKQLHRDDKLIQTWDPEPTYGTTSHRVVGISVDDVETDCNGFDLDK